MTRDVKRRTVRLHGSDGVRVLAAHKVVYLDGMVEPIMYKGRVYRFEYTNTDQDGKVLSVVFREIEIERQADQSVSRLAWGRLDL